ncbi:hypothetical protein [Novosphingobium sp. fls2-241-R2A-195]|uniref:hypothetical protein n=1 Tax=Novosphingobium sp. fls2-241-R2A-195 TaxID=3040296 RepID=UPI00254A450E|nr:hypothetical protein [Novosphingobium sp. fls2-241-R2A-195]
MNNHIRRIEALEVSMSPPIGRTWHRVVQHVGQTRESAVAAHEAEHGAFGANDAVVLRRIVSPPH